MYLENRENEKNALLLTEHHRLRIAPHMFVTAFAGARDYYSLPQALHEMQLLERHVSDLYFPDILTPSFFKIKRNNPGLPFKKAYIDLKALQLNLGIRLDKTTIQAVDRWLAVDKSLSLRAAAIAKKTGADLFLHSNYAYWGFNELPHVKKYMFQFHPIAAGVSKLLESDFELNPEVEWSFRHEADSLPENKQLVERKDEWKFADKIVCASSFTKRTLIEVGCEEKNITVVPYGIESRLTFNIRDVTPKICRFLFVGQGVQRKGLHHLLKAWRLCRPDRSELIIVASRVDPGIAPLLEQPQVRYFPWVSNDALQKLFEKSDVFVMPSLVEGFGLVFGEALSAGLFCIGTTNTGLADLELAEDEAKILEVHQIGNYTSILSNTLNEVANKILTSKRIRTSLTKSMEKFTWASHRNGIKKFLSDQNW